MHEMSLALSIVEQTLLAARKEGAIRVVEVEIEIGRLAGVMSESLRFCLEAVGPAGGLPDTVFRLVEVGGEGGCRACTAAFTADSFFAKCPVCGSDETVINGGQGLKIRSLIIED